MTHTRPARWTSMQRAMPRGHCQSITVSAKVANYHKRKERCAQLIVASATSQSGPGKVYIDAVEQSVSAFAPATIANLGPGFDWMGCAVDVSRNLFFLKFFCCRLPYIKQLCRPPCMFVLCLKHYPTLLTGSRGYRDGHSAFGQPWKNCD